MINSPTHALIRRIPRSYPDYYAKKNIKISFGLADRQHEKYVQVLQSAGLKISYIPADETKPDCVFIEDTAFIWQNHTLITHMCSEREGEQKAVEETLRHTHTITHIPSVARLEGGDILHTENVTYVGLSARTNNMGAECLKNFLKKFGRPVVKVPVEKCLHLKSGITYIGDNTLVAVPDWFDMNIFDVENIIFTQEGEERAANCMRIPNHLLVQEQYPKTAELLEHFAKETGLQLHLLDTSEFAKADGSLTCLSLLW
jgi:dimethylargininase